MTHVLIPFRPDSPERHDALVWVRQAWNEAGYKAAVSTDRSESPWCKASAIDHGMNWLLRDEDPSIVISDADCFISGPTTALLNDWHDWAIPHRRIFRLGPELTRIQLLGKSVPDPTNLPRDLLEEPPYNRIGAAGGIVVLKRDVWNRVPMDPRFLGWGFEDVAWFYALHTLVGPPGKGKANLIHLWHPRSVPEDRTERSMAENPNLELLNEYKAARRNPARMQVLVDEAKAALRRPGRSWEG